MKSFHQFREEASYAIENLILEAKGFGEIVDKRRKAKKQKDLKSSPRLSDVKRTAKINLLKARTGGADELWKGLN